MSSANDGFFMITSAALGSESKSFEEIRIDDYIKAYQSTGHPPPPCPQEPTDELQRSSLNLPPLFKPHPIRTSTSTTTSTTTPLFSTFGTSTSGKTNNLNQSDAQLELPAPRINNPAELPPGQEFRLPLISGEKYHCISCMQVYMNFSLEELRYYAYLRGNTKPPASVTMDPFIQLVQEASSTTPLSSFEDQFQSISAEPQYDKHSHEELRVAFLLFGREMTSAELVQLQNPSTTTSQPAPPPNQPILTVPGRSIPPPIFAAPASIPIPKFTFGLR